MQFFAKRIRACRGYRFSQRGCVLYQYRRSLPTARRASVKELGFCVSTQSVGQSPNYKFKNTKKLNSVNIY